MKLVLAILILVLTISICSQQVSAAPTIPVGTLCCERYIRGPLPLTRLVGYIIVHSTFYCSRAAVIFKTVKDRLVCADPKHQWVQERVRDLQEKVQHA
ncbi:C-C motif chemokine 7-like [Heterodontus francisci]|uniref:C-C motif chemokine 7-like n=1 Tax=Heterodontus francisci TaxID=7792 RepID=UPI00355B6285